MPILEVADRLGIAGLKPAGAERVGPCPVCGGRDRFGINRARNLFNCRHCGGGDTIALVRLVLGIDFKAALAWLAGEAEAEVDPAERAARERRLRAAAERRRAEEEKRRAAAIRRLAPSGPPGSLQRARRCGTTCRPVA